MKRRRKKERKKEWRKEGRKEEGGRGRNRLLRGIVIDNHRYAFSL